jgi:hemerythrin
MALEKNGKVAPFVIKWRDGFKTNIAQVDDEHRHLFVLVKALDLETVEHTIEELLDYVVMHFSHEQELMEKSGYPAFEQHLKLHEDFGAHVAEFLGSGEHWTEERIQELRHFLNKWLIGHIMTHDLRFGKWYVEHSMPAVPAFQIQQQIRSTQGARPEQNRQVASAAQAIKEERGFFARLFGIGRGLHSAHH